MKGSEDDKARSDRRGFLKLAAVGTVTGGGLIAGNAKADAAPAEANGQDGLYRETEHVKRYYDLARF